MHFIANDVLVQEHAYGIAHFGQPQGALPANECQRRRLAKEKRDRVRHHLVQHAQ